MNQGFKKFQVHEKKISIQCNDLTFLFSKIADVGLPETPSPLELAKVGSLDPLPP